MVELLAARGRPLQQLDGAVDRDAFLVAGDQERDRAFRLAAVGREVVERRGDLAGDRAFHVDRAAAVEHAFVDLARERRMAPARLVARRHHVGMAGEHQMRRGGADARVEIFHRIGAGLLEGDAMRRSKPAPLSTRSMNASAPPSAGVTEGQRSRSRARAMGSAAASSCFVSLVIFDSRVDVADRPPGCRRSRRCPATRRYFDQLDREVEPCDQSGAESTERQPWRLSGIAQALRHRRAR